MDRAEVSRRRLKSMDRAEVPRRRLKSMDRAEVPRRRLKSMDRAEENLNPDCRGFRIRRSPSFHIPLGPHSGGKLGGGGVGEVGRGGGGGGGGYRGTNTVEAGGGATAAVRRVELDPVGNICPTRASS